MRKQVFSLFLGITVSLAVFAQPQPQESYSFDLQQCIDFALQNQSTYLSAKLDVLGSKGRVGEIRAVGLPQANINANYLINPQVQKQFVPANAFSSPQLVALGTYVGELGANAGIAPPAGFTQSTSNAPTAIGLATMYSASATLAVTQLIFDGTFIVGLQAAKALVDLSSKSVVASEMQLLENVTKAYYLVVINKEREKIFDNNIARIDSTLRQLKITRNVGFAEDIDVMRLEVTLNNLLIEKEKFKNIQVISNAALKFQMGFPMEKELIVTGQISDLPLNGDKGDLSQDFNYEKRAEYSVLESRRKLLSYDIKQNNYAYLPRLSAFFNYGQNTGTYEIGDLFNKWNYKEFHNYGLSLNIPVFDGFSKSYKIQQAKVNLSKAENDIKNIKNLIDFQREQSSRNLANNLKTLESQKKNLSLSEEVARVVKIKYLKGVGSNLDVITAESTLKESQINYYNSLYDAILSKIDLDKANGNLK